MITTNGETQECK